MKTMDRKGTLPDSLSQIANDLAGKAQTSAERQGEPVEARICSSSSDLSDTQRNGVRRNIGVSERSPNFSYLMSLMNLFRGELIEIIEWIDDSRDTLAWRFPDDDKAIKNGAQLIVRESQVAQLVMTGQFADTFWPGKHTLSTPNVPVLARIQGWKYGFVSPFKVDIYFVSTRLFTGNKWGTSNPVMMRDQDFGVVRLRAFGTFDFKVVNAQLFLKEVVGTDQNFRIDEFADTMRSRVVSAFSDALATAKIPALDVASRYGELGEALVPAINPAMIGKYGLEVTSFILENVSVPPEVEQAIDKRSGMSVVGNLNDYVKYQMGQGMAQGGGAAGAPAEMAIGFAMAQQMMRDVGQPAPAASTPPPLPGVPPPLPGAASPAAGAPEVFTPEQVAERLGVAASDVVAAVESGELKGRKIGSQLRITKAALDDFLAH